MSAKYTFILQSKDSRKRFPHKVIIGQQDTETEVHVLLKLMGYLLFFRDRLQMELNLRQENIPFVPDLVELDYQLRPRLWVECGECSVGKLNKLAVKVPEAEIWIVKKSPVEVHNLQRLMEREELRRNRYGMIGLDPEMFAELHGLLGTRNQVFWVGAKFDSPSAIQLEFNGLWFDAPFTVVRF